jgi:hypothetical protein
MEGGAGTNFPGELNKEKDLLFATVSCGNGSSFLAKKKGGKEEEPRLGMVLNRMGPSFTEVVRSNSGLDAMMMPIVGGFPSLYMVVVWSEPFRHSSLWTSLAKPCAIDILPAVRSVECEVLRLTVDCSMLEIPPVDPMGKEKLLCPLGKKKLEAGLSARGSTGSARRSNARLNLRTWSELLARFNLVVGRVVRFSLGHKIKGFCLGWFMPKPKFKERNQAMVASKITGHVLDPEAVVSAKCLQCPAAAHGSSSAAVSGVVLGLSTFGGWFYVISVRLSPLANTRDVDFGGSGCSSGSSKLCFWVWFFQFLCPFAKQLR